MKTGRFLNRITFQLFDEGAAGGPHHHLVIISNTAEPDVINRFCFDRARRRAIVHNSVPLYSLASIKDNDTVLDYDLPQFWSLVAALFTILHESNLRLYTTPKTGSTSVMNGTITFSNLTDLALFLKEFTGSTATFEVHEVGRSWVLEFKGGF